MKSSGIIEVFDIFGKGYWLLDIQAHTLGESGQLLLMNNPGFKPIKIKYFIFAYLIHFVS